jgi:hypothetical protein
VGMLVTMGAMLQCSFGAAPSALSVLPVNRVLTAVPAASIMDNKPFMNIMPFGVCNSMSNPVVAAATAAALGALTPMPCIPVTPAPWLPGAPTVLVGNMPALNSDSKCMCAWGGVISITSPGNFTVSTP